jgi:hypothetical protein
VKILTEGCPALDESQLREVQARLCDAGLASPEAVTATYTFGESAARRRSSVVPVTYSDSAGAAVELYLKFRRDPAGHESFKSWAQYGQQLSGLLAPYSIAIPLALQVGSDPPSLLMTKVGGRPMGRAIRYALRRQGRVNLVRIAEDVGTFIRCLEQVTATTSDNLDSALIGATRVELSTLVDVLGRRLLASTIGRLDELEALKPHGCPHALAHGDLNSENVRVPKGGVGVIDIGWKLKPAGYDLAFWFSHVRSQLFASPTVLNDVVEASLLGYGDPGVVETPGYLACDIRLAVRAIATIAEQRSHPIAIGQLRAYREHLGAAVDARQ